MIKKAADLPDVHEVLSEMRTLLSENRVEEAENILSNALKEKRYQV